jgi:hypothetical protein
MNAFAITLIIHGLFAVDAFAPTLVRILLVALSIAWLITGYAFAIAFNEVFVIFQNAELPTFLGLLLPTRSPTGISSWYTFPFTFINRFIICRVAFIPTFLGPYLAT